MSNKRKRGRRTDATGRTRGESKHVRLYDWELRSAAYQSLSPVGRALLIEFKRLYNGENNGELFLSVREAAKRLSVSVNYARKGLGELQSRGFIRARERGSFDRKIRHATVWILTEYEFAGQLPTKDFMRWEPTENKTRYHEKIPTVSREDTVTPKMKPKTPLTVSREDTVTRQIRPLTVSREDTQIVYQDGGPSSEKHLQQQRSMRGER